MSYYYAKCFVLQRFMHGHPCSCIYKYIQLVCKIFAIAFNFEILKNFQSIMLHVRIVRYINLQVLIMGFDGCKERNSVTQSQVPGITPKTVNFSTCAAKKAARFLTTMYRPSKALFLQVHVVQRQLVYLTTCTVSGSNLARLMQR